MNKMIPAEREKKLHEQQDFIRSTEHDFVVAFRLVEEGDVSLHKLEGILENKKRTWGEAKNEIATKRRLFEEKLAKVKGLPEDLCEDYRGDLHTALVDFRNACQQGLSRLR